MEVPHAQAAPSQHQLQYRFGTKRPASRRTHQMHPRPGRQQQTNFAGRRPDPMDRNTSDRIAEKTLHRLANTQFAHYDSQPGFYGITHLHSFRVYHSSLKPETMRQRLEILGEELRKLL